ncbi:hypothetical protein [Candidatus Scalindua japonica]|nr:hypothetical protein [Candidatus Scalindua japonica]
MKVLNTEEKDFFSTLKETAFINPFSLRRQELNRKIAGIKNLSGEQLLRKMINSVADRIKQIEMEGRGDLGSYTGEKREIMRIALLFDIYQRCGTYEEVARKTKLDRRTVRKYIHTTKQYH